MEVRHRSISRLALAALCVVSFLAAVHALEPLLVIRCEGVNFDQTVKGLTYELEEEFSISEFIIDNKTSIKALKKELSATAPRIVVLLDNKAINLYKKYQAEIPDSLEVVPVVALMGVWVNKAIEGMRNTTGISYEIPIVTSVVYLRQVLKRPMEKVGIIHREFMEEFVNENKQYCARENIELVTSILPKDDLFFELKLKKSIKMLLKDEKVNALWIPNDNVLLKPDFIANTWIPLAKKYKVPVIVGIEQLVKPEYNFGTFAVLPDHVSLGSQAAEMVWDIYDNDWEVFSAKAQPPLSVYKIINFQQAKKYFGTTEEDIQSVDRIAE